MTRLEVLICTYGPEGLSRVSAMNLVPADGVGYLISCQSMEMPVPEALRRPDIRVVFSPTRGLSNNRNNALDHATADYALLCDDDIITRAEAYPEIIKAFDENSDMDIATFMIDFPEKKVYPPCGQDLWKPFKGYEACSVEIAFRVKSVKEKNLRFNPMWGIGAPRLGSGEEAIFLLMAKMAGLQGQFIPIVIGAHPYESTGERSEPAVLRAHGAYIRLVHPVTALPRLLLKARRMPSGFFRNLRHLAEGALYASRHKSELLS